MCWVHQCHNCWNVIFVDRPCGRMPCEGIHCVGSLRDAFYSGLVPSKTCPFCGAYADDPNRIV